MSYQLSMEVIGRNGQTLSKRWETHPEAYLAIAVDGFPNMFFSMGPNCGPTSGSTVSIIEREIRYIAAALQKLQRERLKSIEVKREAVEDFNEYAQVSVESLSCVEGLTEQFLLCSSGILQTGKSSASRAL